MKHSKSGKESHPMPGMKKKCDLKKFMGENKPAKKEKKKK